MEPTTPIKSTQRATLDELKSRIHHLDEMRSQSPAEEHEFEALLARAEDMQAAIRSVEQPKGGGTRTAYHSARPLDLRTADRTELRDGAMRIVETEGRTLSPRQLDHVDRLLRSKDGNVDGAVIARRVLVTETDPYRSAFAKAITEPMPIFTPEEGAALLEFRAMNEGTGSAGQVGVPVLIDPSIILTSGAMDAPIVDMSRVVTITTDAWKGVSSAAVSWSYDTEASTVSDDSPTLAQPTIPVYAARGFIPYSVEIGQDYPNFAEELSSLLGQGLIDLMANQTLVGSGSSSPRGIFTAMAATTAGSGAAHVAVTTLGTIGAVDIRKAWASLPQRFRANASWVMSPTVEAQVRALGNNLNIADFTVNLAADGTPVLTGRPVVTSDYAPAFTGTTGTANYAVVGDFSQGFLIAQRAGMSVEIVSHMLDTTSGRPTGQRGLFAWARHGHDIVNAGAFRLLSNS